MMKKIKSKPIKCKYGNRLKSPKKCTYKNRFKNLKRDTHFKDKRGRKIHLGDLIKVYNRDIRRVKWDRAWNIDDRERCFGVTMDKQHKPLYRYGSKNMEIIINKQTRR